MSDSAEQPDWFENDELFLRECAEGHRWERYIAGLLRREGFDADTPKQTLREHVSEAPEYLEDSDVIVKLPSVDDQGNPWERELSFEVKSRKVMFRTPRDFPYEHIFVDTVSGWDAKNPRPAAVICVSQFTHQVMVLSSGTQEHWGIEKRHDRLRGFTTDFYVAPRELWAPWGSFVRRLRKLSS